MRNAGRRPLAPAVTHAELAALAAALAVLVLAAFAAGPRRGRDRAEGAAAGDGARYLDRRRGRRQLLRRPAAAP
jgi:hypothetical protein